MVPYRNLTCVDLNTKVSTRQEFRKLLPCPVHVENYVMKLHIHTHGERTFPY